MVLGGLAHHPSASHSATLADSVNAIRDEPQEPLDDLLTAPGERASRDFEIH